MNSIPVYQLENGNTEMFEIRRFLYGEPDDVYIELHQQSHRDGHFLFFVMNKGNSHAMIDFNDVLLAAPSVCYILPSQVHRRINNLEADYWVIAIDPSVIPAACRAVFDRQRNNQTNFACPEVEHKRFVQVTELIHSVYKHDRSASFYQSALSGLLNTFITMAADCFRNMYEQELTQTRLVTLYGQFKQLLASDVVHVKSASAYAEKLNVSETYLNEATKKVSGFPVSHWIRQEVILEAKRLLYNTNMDVKQIAHVLGYDDHSYFSRIFRKTAGMPASTFRGIHRK
jgi:AraC family transcriptional activator of pobA